MRPRGTGTSVLTWLFNPRVGRDLAVSRPQLPQPPHQHGRSLHSQDHITVLHGRSRSSTKSADPKWSAWKLHLKRITFNQRKQGSQMKCLGIWLRTFPASLKKKPISANMKQKNEIHLIRLISDKTVLKCSHLFFLFFLSERNKLQYDVNE